MSQSAAAGRSASTPRTVTASDTPLSRSTELQGWAALHYRRSLASRVTLLATFAVGLSVTVVALAAYATVRQQSLNTLDDSLHTRALVAAHTDPYDVLTNQSIPTWALGAANVKFAFIDTRLGVAYPPGTTNADRLRLGTPEARVADRKAEFSARTVSVQGVDYRAVAVPAGSPGQALVIGQSLEPTQRMLDRLGLVMLLLGLAGVIAATLAGWAVARSGLRPVRHLTRAVEEIARTERLDPLRVEGDDEVARLAIAFNQMLAALSASQSRQRQLVADAGHELRTPLTSLRTNLDLLVQADGSGGSLSAESRRELMDDVRGQIEEMTTLIGDLVELAREEPMATRLEPTDLADVIGQAVTRVRRRTTSVTLDVRTEPWWVTGDAPALERAITNLLDNAVKWSPEGGTVHLTLRQGTVQVTDEGSGIAPEDLPHVFDRFYRSAESRGMAGSGLGLSIVRAVAERHGGAVRAGSRPGGGAAFWFSVPGSSTAPQVLAAP